MNIENPIINIATETVIYIDRTEHYPWWPDEAGHMVLDGLFLEFIPVTHRPTGYKYMQASIKYDEAKEYSNEPDAYIECHRDEEGNPRYKITMEHDLISVNNLIHMLEMDHVLPLQPMPKDEPNEILQVV